MKKIHLILFLLVGFISIFSNIYAYNLKLKTNDIEDVISFYTVVKSSEHSRNNFNLKEGEWAPVSSNNGTSYDHYDVVGFIMHKEPLSNYNETSESIYTSIQLNESWFMLYTLSNNYNVINFDSNNQMINIDSSQVTSNETVKLIQNYTNSTIGKKVIVTNNYSEDKIIFDSTSDGLVGFRMYYTLVGNKDYCVYRYTFSKETLSDSIKLKTGKTLDEWAEEIGKRNNDNPHVYISFVTKTGFTGNLKTTADFLKSVFKSDNDNNGINGEKIEKYNNELNELEKELVNVKSNYDRYFDSNGSCREGIAPAQCSAMQSYKNDLESIKRNLEVKRNSLIVLLNSYKDRASKISDDFGVWSPKLKGIDWNGSFVPGYSVANDYDNKLYFDSSFDVDVKHCAYDKKDTNLMISEYKVSNSINPDVTNKSNGVNGFRVINRENTEPKETSYSTTSNEIKEAITTNIKNGEVEALDRIYVYNNKYKIEYYKNSTDKEPDKKEEFEDEAGDGKVKFNPSKIQKDGYKKIVIIYYYDIKMEKPIYINYVEYNKDDKSLSVIRIPEESKNVMINTKNSHQIRFSTNGNWISMYDEYRKDKVYSNKSEDKKEYEKYIIPIEKGNKGFLFRYMFAYKDKIDELNSKLNIKQEDEKYRYLNKIRYIVGKDENTYEQLRDAIISEDSNVKEKSAKSLTYDTIKNTKPILVSFLYYTAKTKARLSVEVKHCIKDTSNTNLNISKYNESNSIDPDITENEEEEEGFKLYSDTLPLTVYNTIRANKIDNATVTNLKNSEVEAYGKTYKYLKEYKLQYYEAGSEVVSYEKTFKDKNGAKFSPSGIYANGYSKVVVTFYYKTDSTEETPVPEPNPPDVCVTLKYLSIKEVSIEKDCQTKDGMIGHDFEEACYEVDKDDEVVGGPSVSRTNTILVPSGSDVVARVNLPIAVIDGDTMDRQGYGVYQKVTFYYETVEKILVKSIYIDKDKDGTVTLKSGGEQISVPCKDEDGNDKSCPTCKKMADKSETVDKYNVDTYHLELSSTYDNFKVDSQPGTKSVDNYRDDKFEMLGVINNYDRREKLKAYEKAIEKHEKIFDYEYVRKITTKPGRDVEFPIIGTKNGVCGNVQADRYDTEYEREYVEYQLLKVKVEIVGFKGFYLKDLEILQNANGDNTKLFKDNEVKNSEIRTTITDDKITFSLTDYKEKILSELKKYFETDEWVATLQQDVDGNYIGLNYYRMGQGDLYGLYTRLDDDCKDILTEGFPTPSGSCTTSGFFKHLYDVKDTWKTKYTQGMIFTEWFNSNQEQSIISNPISIKDDKLNGERLSFASALYANYELEFSSTSKFLSFTGNRHAVYNANDEEKQEINSAVSNTREELIKIESEIEGARRGSGYFNGKEYIHWVDVDRINSLIEERSKVNGQLDDLNSRKEELDSRTYVDNDIVWNTKEMIKYSNGAGVNIANPATLEKIDVTGTENIVSQTMGSKKSFNLQFGVETTVTPRLSQADSLYTNMSISERKSYIKYYMYAFTFQVKYVSSGTGNRQVDSGSFEKNGKTFYYITIEVDRTNDIENIESSYIDTQGRITVIPIGSKSQQQVDENYYTSKVNIEKDTIITVAATKNILNVKDIVELYRNETTTVKYTEISIARVCNEDTTSLTTRNVDSSLTQFGQRIRNDANYLSQASIETDNISRVYGFKVTDCTDVNFKNVFRKESQVNGVNENTGIVYLSGVRKFEIFNSSEAGKTQYENVKDSKLTLPLGPYKHNSNTYVEAPKLGYRISFDLKTSGYYLANTNTQRKVVIFPRLYYVSKDGKTFIENVDAYYKNSAGKYIKIPQESNVNEEQAYINAAKNGNLAGGYKISYIPNDGYRNVLNLGITNKEDFFTKNKMTLDMSSIILDKQMMCTNYEAFIQSWYGEYKLPNSTIVVKFGESDLNKNLKDGYIGVVFYIGVVEITSNRTIVISYNTNDKMRDYGARTNTTQWDYEGYLGFSNPGSEVNGNLTIQLAKGKWNINNEIYQKIKGTVALFDLDNRAASDFD